jgi:hypothetical protein
MIGKFYARKFLEIRGDFGWWVGVRSAVDLLVDLLRKRKLKSPV